MNDCPDGHDTPCSFTFALVTSAQGVEARVEASLRDVGLSLAKVKLLRHLSASKEPLPLGALAELNACVKSNVTQLMDRLEAEGLVRRLPDPEDRRSVLAQITPEGRKKYDQATKVMAAAEAEIFSTMDEGERNGLLRLLERLKGATV